MRQSPLFFQNETLAVEQQVSVANANVASCLDLEDAYLLSYTAADANMSIAMGQCTMKFNNSTHFQRQYAAKAVCCHKRCNNNHTMLLCIMEKHGDSGSAAITIQ